MSEEETLKLISKVEDEFTDPLDDLEDRLEEVDDQIARTGRGRDHVEVHVEATGVGRTLQKLEGLERTLDRIDDADVDISADPDNSVVPDMDASSSSQPQAATSGGRSSDLFTVENIDIYNDEVSPFLDREEFGRRGGEVSRIEDVLSKDIDEVVDFDAAFERAMDDDSDVDLNTLKGIKGLDGPDAFTEAAETLSTEGLTDLGEGRLTRRQRLSNVSERLVFTMGKFHQIIASLIPLAGLFVGAMPAAIAGVTALGGAALAAAGALGAVGALGAMGMGLQQDGQMGLQPLADRLDEIGQTFADAFGPLARALRPALTEALTVIENMAGPLAQASSGLLAFKDEFIGMANFVATNLPPLVNQTLSFAHAIMPLASAFFQFLANSNIVGIFADQLAKALPHLIGIGNAIIDILPFVMRISHAFLVFVDVLFRTTGFLLNFINHIPFLAEALALATGAFLTAVSAMTIYTAVTTGASGATLTLAKSVLSLIGKAIASYIAVLGMTFNAISAYTGSTLAAAAATFTLAAAIAAVTAGLSLLAAGAIKNLTKMGGKVGDVRDELNKLNQSGNALGSTSFGSSSSSPYTTGSGMVDNSTTIIDATDKDSAARQQYASKYEQQQQIDSVFSR